MLLPLEGREAILNHAHWCHPLEACGLLAVDPDGRIARVYPLTNRDASPVRFMVDPAEQFGAVNHAEDRGWEIGGAFHSHPDGRAILSPVDLAAIQPQDWIQIVVGFVPRLEIRAWKVNQGEPRELTLSPLSPTEWGPNFRLPSSVSGGRAGEEFLEP